MTHVAAVRLVAWLLAFFALFFVLDRIGGAILERAYARVEVGEGAGHGRYSSLQTDAEFVVLGSSRARNHVDTTRVEESTGLRAYNAGANGQGLYYARAMQLALQARGSALRVLLVHVSPGDLTAPDTGRATVLRPLATLSPELEALFIEMDPWHRFKSLSKIYAYNTIVVPIILNAGKKANRNARGFAPRVGVMDTDAADRTVSDSASLDIFSPSAVSVGVLDAMIGDAASNGYSIVFFTAPYYAVAGTRKGDTLLSTEQSAAAWLTGYFGRRGISYLSFNSVEAADFPHASMYWDSIHLNSEHTSAFTDLLIERLSSQLPNGRASESAR